MTTANLPSYERLLHHHRLAIALALSTLIYLPILFNGYSLDDVYYTTDQCVLKGMSSTQELLTTYTIQRPNEVYAYRPLTAITFAAEQSIFGSQDAMRGHIISLLLYLLMVYLAYWLARGLFMEEMPWLQTIALFLFALHPLHAEVVASIKNRDALLAGVFGFAFLLSFMKYFATGRISLLILGTVALLLGVMSKMSLISSVLLVPLVWYFIADRGSRRHGWIWSGMSLGVVALFVLFIRPGDGADTIRTYFSFENPLYMPEAHLGHRIGIGAQCLWHYISEVVAPYPLSCFYGMNVFNLEVWSDSRTYMGIVLGLTLLVLFLKNVKGRRPLALGIAWMLISLAMYLNVVGTLPGVVADRFALEMLLGAGMVIGYGAQQFNWMRWPLLLVLLLLSIWTSVRCTHWYSERSLFERDITFLPESVKLNNMMAATNYKEAMDPAASQDLRMGKLDEAMKYQQASLHLYPSYAKGWNNLGSYAMLGGRTPQEALAHFERAIQADADFAPPYYGRAVVLNQLNRRAEAIQSLQHCLHLDPNHQRSKALLQRLQD